MDRKRPSRLYPLAFLLVVALGLLGLGWRLHPAQRAEAELRTGVELAGIATRYAARLLAAASRLEREVLLGPGEVLVDQEGRFLAPRSPRPLEDLPAPSDLDPVAAFYLLEASRVASGEAPKARGLLEAAVRSARGVEARLQALYQLVILHLQEDQADEVRSAQQSFLEALPEELRCTSEALLVRALARPVDDQLQEDLLLHLGLGQEPIVTGLLGRAGLLDPGAPGTGALEARRQELTLMERLRPFLPATEAPPGGCRLVEGWLLAWARQADGPVRLAELPAPPRPPGVQVLQPGDRASLAGLVGRTVEVGEPLAGVRVLATRSRIEVQALARQLTLELGATAALVLVAIGIVLALWLRARRLELEAARERAALIAGVSHNLRTPLSLIRMYAETLESGKVTDAGQAREFAGIVSREAERLGNQVSRALDLSRLRSPASLQHEDLDLRRLVREVCEAHAPLLRRAGVALELELPPGELRLHGDADALRGALGSLLENALEHAPKGPVQVRLEQDGAGVELEVRDHGPGFPPELGERAFDRFVRGPAAQHRGTGLGLALVREVARAHGGEAVIRSMPEGGAAVVISLPAVEEEP